VPAARIGVTGGDAVTVPGLLELPVERLRTTYEGTLPALMGEA
jgi:hypothetical protein